MNRRSNGRHNSNSYETENTENSSIKEELYDPIFNDENQNESSKIYLFFINKNGKKNQKLFVI